MINASNDRNEKKQLTVLCVFVNSIGSVKMKIDVNDRTLCD